MKVNDRFDIREYVPKEVWDKHGSNSVRFVDQALMAADYELLLDLEEHLGCKLTCTINNWLWGGTRSQCGLRVPGQKLYRETSLHASGKASDKIYKYASGPEAGKRVPHQLIYDFVLANQDTYWSLGIRRMEDIRDAKTWLHWDTCWTPEEFSGKLKVVRA